MLAMEITHVLGSSIMAFVLGVFIGIALGYIIWADREDRKDAARLDNYKKTMRERGHDESK